MFLPWAGLFEQVRLADVFMHYDDVQLPQGRSFISRVQVKTDDGPRWLTAPLDRIRSGKMINQVLFCDEPGWRNTHLSTLRRAYARAPHAAQMISLAEEVYAQPTERLDEFNINAIERISSWLGLKAAFCRSSDAGVHGSSSERLVRLCQHADASIYVTGHGAARYLDHELFERSGIEVRYMDYKLPAYPQQHGDFTPYVSILDGIANCGTQVRDLIQSPAVYWKDSGLFQH